MPHEFSRARAARWPRNFEPGSPFGTCRGSGAIDLQPVSVKGRHQVFGRGPPLAGFQNFPRWSFTLQFDFSSRGLPSVSAPVVATGTGADPTRDRFFFVPVRATACGRRRNPRRAPSPAISGGQEPLSSFALHPLLSEGPPRPSRPANPPPDGVAAPPNCESAWSICSPLRHPARYLRRRDRAAGLYIALTPHFPTRPSLAAAAAPAPPFMANSRSTSQPPALVAPLAGSGSRFVAGRFRPPPARNSNRTQAAPGSRSIASGPAGTRLLGRVSRLRARRGAALEHATLGRSRSD